MEIILVPGLWLDGSSWDDVVPVLEKAGHRPHPVTLLGMTATTTNRAEITLRDQVAAVVELVDQLDGEIVLVGHSGGAAVVHAVVDARPDRIVRTVYVDAWPSGPGQVVNDGLPVENGEIPLPDWSVFDDEDLVGLDEQLRAAFRARALPSPAGAARDPQQLTDERRYDVPVTVISTAYPSAKLREWITQGVSSFEELGRIRNVTWLDLPTGHWPQFSRPQDLGRAILEGITPTQGA